MSSVTVVALAAILGAVLLFVIAIMMWQESRRRPSQEPAEFILEDAADHVAAVLDPATSASLDRDDVLAIIEWHMRSVTDSLRAGQAPVVGLTADAVSYISDRRPDLMASDIEAVLTAVPDYVASIGAVGPAF